MVCVPCFIIPVLLVIWRLFIQPILLRFWNPWGEKKDEKGNVIKNDVNFPFQCVGGSCKYIGNGAAKGVDDKKNDEKMNDKGIEIKATESKKEE